MSVGAIMPYARQSGKPRGIRAGAVFPLNGMTILLESRAKVRRQERTP
jgi:hypothetical protein